MKDIAVSRRYAKALMLIGGEDGNADKYRNELSGFAALMEKETELSETISNPLYPVAERRMVLQEILKKVKMSKLMKAFAVLLFDKGRYGFLNSVNEHYQMLADELKGVAHASVVSAVELSSDAVKKIQASLSALTGKDVVLDVEQDPELIGGIVTKIGDLVLDGSIRTQILNMRDSFKRGEIV
jgi:F-type H+-transporting ATPase subunit delta